MAKDIIKQCSCVDDHGPNKICNWCKGTGIIGFARGHGGKRKGSGRPASTTPGTDRKISLGRMTDKEFGLVINMLPPSERKAVLLKAVMEKWGPKDQWPEDPDA